MARNSNKSFFDVRHPVFRPFWRRALLTGVCFLWALFEFSNGQIIWAVVFGACGVHLFLQFFVLFDPADYETQDKPKG